MNEAREQFVPEAVAVFRSQKDLADRAIAQVSDANLHSALHLNTNSIAVTMKHLAGNMISRWTHFLTSDGEKPDRHRDDEFVDRFTSRDEVMAYWERGWRALFDALDSLSAPDLEKTITIRGEAHSVIRAIDRQLSHYGYHVGQIVLIARVLAGGELDDADHPARRVPAIQPARVEGSIGIGIAWQDATTAQFAKATGRAPDNDGTGALCAGTKRNLNSPGRSNC